jgi:tetratricopeptide (TPR) repeat protein
LEKELPVGFRYYGSTNSLEAFRYFIYGQKAFHKGDFSSAAKLFSQSIAIDSNFISAVFGLSYSYFNQGWYDERYYDEAKKWCVRLYKKREQIPMEQKISTNKLYAAFFGTPYEEIEYIRQLRELDDKSPNTYYSLGYLYYKLYKFDKAIPEFEKALEIYKNWGTKPKWVYNYTNLGMGFIETGQYKKAKKLFKKAEQDFPDNLSLIMSKAILSLVEKDTVTANKYIEKYISIHKSDSPSEEDIVLDLAFLYREAGILEKAEEYYRSALSLQPENPNIMNFLAWLLIDKEININEGLELIDKALELSPDDWYILDTKGWGLYKQGKYQEALDFLRKPGI